MVLGRCLLLPVRLFIFDFVFLLTYFGDVVGLSNGSKSTSEVMASSWAIRIPLRSGMDDGNLRKIAKDIAHETGLSFHGQIGGLRGHFLLVHETFYRENTYNGTDLEEETRRISEGLEKHPEVEWSMQETVRKRYKRSLRFKDSYFPSQWHLVS